MAFPFFVCSPIFATTINFHTWHQFSNGFDIKSLTGPFQLLLSDRPDRLHMDINLSFRFLGGFFVPH